MTFNPKTVTDGETAERTPRKPPFGAPHVFVFAITDGSTSAVHRLAKPETVIGRGEEADIPVEDEEVSRRHCLIRVEGPVCTLVDLGSLNGTFLNGRVLKGISSRLRHLDEVQVGGTRMMLLNGRFRSKPKRS